MSRFFQLWMLLVACLPSTAQSLPPAKPPSQGMVRRVRIIPEDSGAALEVISSAPLTPDIQKIEGPSRLVIDLPGSLASSQKNIDFRDEKIRGIRVDQFEASPPITRIVVDLAAPIEYTWQANGNHLTIHLRPQEQAAEPAPPKPDWSAVSLRPTRPALLPVSSPASGALLLAGNRLAQRSSVTAGSETAVLTLARGGEVRVCPGTTVSLSASRDNQALMLGMSTGALEEHSTLGATTDSVLTPDFRIVLEGPGEFHYAVRVDSHGNTCVRGLPGNTASATVSELLGDGTYEVKPAEEVAFRAGRVALVETTLPGECGCPAPPVPVMRASAESISNEKLKEPIRLGDSGFTGMRPDAAAPRSVLPAESTASSAAKSSEIHVQLDAPLVFRAANPLASNALALPLGNERVTPLLETALPPANGCPKRQGIFKKLKGFFATIFG